MPLDLDRLRALVRAAPPFVLRPRAFFAAWSGVLVVAFEGFPEGALQLQKNLGELPEMPPLLPGARWPKTTLAAVRDEVELVPEQGRALVELCAEWSPRIGEEAPLRAAELSLVDFSCCSLEKRSHVETIPLEGEANSPASVVEHRQAVDRVLRQPERFEAYWPFLSRGTHRAAHYRDESLGKTLVVDWRAGEQPAVIEAFLEAVEKALPGRYLRFSSESRHVTLRNLT